MAKENLHYSDATRRDASLKFSNNCIPNEITMSNPTNL